MGASAGETGGVGRGSGGAWGSAVAKVEEGFGSVSVAK
jgi:hypothetical protein